MSKGGIDGEVDIAELIVELLLLSAATIGAGIFLIGMFVVAASVAA